MVTLVCGVRTEGPVALLVDALERRGADHAVLDQQRLAEQVRCRWQIGDGCPRGDLEVDGRHVAISEIGGVYLRFMSPDHMPRSRGRPALIAQTRSIIRAVSELCDLLPGRVVNRRRPMMSNNSKPYQSLLIREAGFLVPETLITNDPERARAFHRRVGPLIYKSTSSERSIVATLDLDSPDDGRRLASLPWLPTQFQRRIDGINVRVHVIGDRTFAAKIVSDCTDYRYSRGQGGHTSVSEYELTDALHQRCVGLARALQMAFVGVDLILGEEGVYCLEVNPCPGYSYYQQATGTPIADALAAYLDGR